MSAQNLKSLHREAIGHAQRRMGAFAWPTVALALSVVVAHFAALGLLVAGTIPLWAAVAVLLVTVYAAYTPIHEAVHDNIRGEHSSLQWLNDLCGYACGQVLMITYTSHRVEHLIHHRHTNHPEKDPDAMLHGGMGGPWQILVALWRYVWMQYFFLATRHWDKATTRQRAAYLTEAGIALGWRLALLAVLPLASWLLIFVVAYIASIFFLAYWFAYRPHHPYNEQARYRNSKTLLLPRWLRPFSFIWLGQHHHSVHHLFPRVPFYRYTDVLYDVMPAMHAHGHQFDGLFGGEPPQDAPGYAALRKQQG